MRPLRVRLEREGILESVHDVHGFVCGLVNGESERFGEATLASFWRSSMKPFQALPLVRDGALGRLGLGERELALTCASHHAMPEHVDIVRGVLDRLGLDEAALACGPHRPVDPESALALDRLGRLPGRIHNNCSGKHAGMLALAARSGWPLEDYHLSTHPLQTMIRGELSGWIDSDPESLDWGVDGCGVPTPALPLEEMARAYARLGAAEEPAPRAVVSAMTRHPMLISGPTAFSAQLMSATEGRVLGKEGAEGVFCLVCPADGWGAAFKVVDGAMRALGPAILCALTRLQLLRAEETHRLEAFVGRPIENTRGEPVATLRAELHGG